MHKRHYCVLMLASSLLSGCSDPRDASKENFTQAIQAFLDTQGNSICAPIKGIEPPLLLPKDTGLNKWQHQQMDALAQAGLLSKSDKMVEVEQGFMTRTKVKVPGFEYNLTQDGKAFFKTGRQQAWGYDEGAFCFGQPKVTEIATFTEPADMMGMKISRVTYQLALGAIPDWAEREAIRTAYPQLRQSLSRNQGKAVLVLTDSGWVHEKLLK